MLLPALKYTAKRPSVVVILVQNGAGKSFLEWRYHSL